MPFEVIHFDEQFVVINKPHGLLSVPGKNLNLPNAYQHLNELLGQTVHVVHRLDMSTSGLLMFALNKSALVQLQRQFSQREVHKVYECLVTNNIKGQQGTINAPLLVDWPNRPKQKVDYIQGKSALTRWRKLSGNQEFSRLELYPHTGRSHQLRVHLMHIGHSIIGDELYAQEKHRRGRLMLHAKELYFKHPKNHKPICLTSPTAF